MAKAEGVEATSRLITDWVELGFLDHPRRTGLGYGRGWTEGTWSSRQTRLWQSLVRQRPKLKQVGPLANVPVFTWLLGEDGVPVEQVRRAMNTWLGRYRTTSERRSLKTVRQIVADFVDLDATSYRARQALTDVLTRTAMTGTVDEAQLHEAFARVDVTEPNRVDHYIRLVKARVLAISDLNELTEDDFARARSFYFRRIGKRVSSMSKADQSRLANNACLDLLTTLGLQRSEALED